MIRKLRIKFVCMVMAIVLAMLGCILVLVVHFNATSMRSQSIAMMQTVAADPFQLGSPNQTSQNVRLPFFVVQINHRGEMIAVSGGYFDLTDRELIQQIALAALRSDQETGELNDYGLRFLKTGNASGQNIVFADTSSETATIRNMVYSCVLIFLAAALAFLGLSVLLSRWAVQPVEKAWNQQRQFVADASHELKTPLSVIMASAELLQDEGDQNARNILTMSYQMRGLVENMLEMARVDNGSLKMDFASLELSQLVEDAVLSFQLLYEEQDMTLSGDIQPDIPVQGSEQHLFQVLDVLLDNALKYSAPQSTVTVQLKQAGKHSLLTVESPGQPLTKEELSNIFKRFYRADAARTVNGSYGLGLSIARSIVDAHRGRIWAESGRGCNCFFVQLPLPRHNHPSSPQGAAPQPRL